MKQRNLLLITFLLFVSILTSAQGFYLGINGGPAFSNRKEKISFDFENYTGYHVGLSFRDTLVNRFHFELGVEINKYKSYVDHLHMQLGPIYYDDVEYSFTLVDFPLKVNYSYPVNNVNFVVSAGGNISLLANARREALKTKWLQEVGWTEDMSNEDASAEIYLSKYGLVVGAGIEYMMQNGLLIQLRTNYKYYFNEDTEDFFDSRTMIINYFQSLQVSLGLMIII